MWKLSLAAAMPAALSLRSGKLPPSLVDLPQDEIAFIDEPPIYQSPMYESARLELEYTRLCFAFPRSASALPDLDKIIKGIPSCMGEAASLAEGNECIRRLATEKLHGMTRSFIGQYVVIPESSECEVTEGWVGNSTYWPCNMSDLICRLWAELQSPSTVCLSNRDGRTVIRTEWNDMHSRFSARLRELGWRGLCGDVFRRRLGGRPIPDRIADEHCLSSYSADDATEVWQAVGACNLCGSSLYEECIYNALLLVGSTVARWLASVMQARPYTCVPGLMCSRHILLGRAWLPSSELDALDKAVQHLAAGMEVCTVKAAGRPARKLKLGTLYISSGPVTPRPEF